MDCDMRKKKDTPIMVVIGVIIISSMALLLLLAFRPIEGEEEEYWELYSRDWDTYFSQEEFQHILEISEQRAAEINKQTDLAGGRQYAPPLKTLSFNPTRFSSEEQAVNTLIYQIAQGACVNEYVTSLPRDLMDPLILLAQSNAENGGLRGGSGALFKILAPAVPACYMEASDITLEKVKSFNIKDMANLNMNTAFNAMEGSYSTYIGPLQMSPGYGGIGDSQSEFLPLLNYPQGEAEVIASDENLLARVNSSGYAKYADRGPGDRWNWNDACVRSIASWDHSFASLASDKEGRITDKYMLACVLALNHNVGLTVLVYKDSEISKGFIKYTSEDSATIGDAWNFATWLSSPNVVAEISRIADSNIASGVLTTRPNYEMMSGLINSFGSSMEPSTFAKMNSSYTVTSGKSVVGWSSEPPMHSLVLLYNYIMLEKLYSGA